MMELLRTPKLGCPWDLKQTFKSIAPSTLEEAYEVVDAIESENYEHLREELGDLLFQVIFYSQLGKEENRFDFSDIVDGLTRKLIKRHPHVFPSGRIELNKMDENDSLDVDLVKHNWEEIKRSERADKGQRGLLDDVPIALPALVRATKLQKRAAGIGFDWPEVDGIWAKLDEEVEEAKCALASGNQEHLEEEVGDLLFTVANLCRRLKVDPEAACRKANEKFYLRFQYIEKRFEANELDIRHTDLQTLEQFWVEAKFRSKP